MSDIRKAHSNVVVLPRVAAPINPYFHMHPSDGGYIPGKAPSSCWRCGGTTHVAAECTGDSKREWTSRNTWRDTWTVQDMVVGVDAAPSGKDATVRQEWKDGRLVEEDCNDRPDGPPLDDQPEDHMRAKAEHRRLWRSNRED